MSRAPGLRERLVFDHDNGCVHDGPRRYLLMRPDVLMGMVRKLPSALQSTVLEAFADSVAEHGADSIRAYHQMTGGDVDALLAVTAGAAADLGWGRWQFSRTDASLCLAVGGSPFAAGHGSSATPVCAPIRGMFATVATTVQGAPMSVTEIECAAQGAGCCRFVAQPGNAGTD